MGSLSSSEWSALVEETTAEWWQDVEVRDDLGEGVEEAWSSTQPRPKAWNTPSSHHDTTTRRRGAVVTAAGEGVEEVAEAA